MPLLFETVGYNKKGFKFIFISVTPKVSEMAPILGEDKDHFTDDVSKVISDYSFSNFKFGIEVR